MIEVCTWVPKLNGSFILCHKVFLTSFLWSLSVLLDTCLCGSDAILSHPSLHLQRKHPNNFTGFPFSANFIGLWHSGLGRTIRRLVCCSHNVSTSIVENTPFSPKSRLCFLNEGHLTQLVVHFAANCWILGSGKLASQNVALLTSVKSCHLKFVTDIRLSCLISENLSFF